MGWTCIAVTAPSAEQALAIKEELLRAKLVPPATLVLAVPDPTDEPFGSGSATLNAILHVAEALSARAGFSTINSEASTAQQRTLVLHVGSASRGRCSAHPCLPKAFCSLPVRGSFDPYASLIDATLVTLSRLFEGMPSGLCIASTDSMLLLPQDVAADAWLDLRHSCLVAVPSTLQQATHHGVCLPAAAHAADAADDGAPPPPPPLRRILYRADEATLGDACGDEEPLLYTGLTFLRAPLAEKLLELHGSAPLDATGYLGIDSGAAPLRLELWSDLLTPLCDAASEDDYVGGGSADDARSAAARRVLWRVLRPLAPLRIARAPRGSRYCYATTPSEWSRDARELGAAVLQAEGGGSTAAGCLECHVLRADAADAADATDAADAAAPDAAAASPPAVVINSALGAGCRVGAAAHVEHCELRAGVGVGEGCFVSGVSTLRGGCELPPHTALLDTTFSVEVLDELERSAAVAAAASPAPGHATPLRRYSSASATFGVPEGVALAEDGAADAARRVTLVFGLHDALKAPCGGGGATFLGEEWSAFVERVGVNDAMLWPSEPPADERCLWNARLFPIGDGADGTDGDDERWHAFLLRRPLVAPSPALMRRWRRAPRASLADAAWRSDTAALLRRRAALARSIDVKLLQRAMLRGRREFVHPIIARFMGSEAQLLELLKVLDDVAADSAHNIPVATKALATIADALAMYAGPAGGLRSGPASNPSFRAAFEALQPSALRLEEAVELLAAQRDRWLQQRRAETMMRAARHYEGAVARCISNGVLTCVCATKATQPPSFGDWAVSEVPSRIDLAGGWSDTPPLCYEHGGAVVTAAIAIDGACALGCRARRLRESKIVISIEGAQAPPTVCTQLDDLNDYCSPLAAGALVKTVLLFSGFVRLRGEAPPLEQQLIDAGGGLEVVTWSRLPTGSGLGTSSILAAAIIASVGAVHGVAYDKADLVHAVLLVEQMLTTGGGWQDQAGGVYPALNISFSPPSLPLTVRTEALQLPREALQRLDAHLALIYTGKTRLARNLLQDVLRRWYSANTAIVANVDALVANAHTMREALLAGDIAAVGASLSAYWEQKKLMCDAEPAAVTRMLAKLRPLIHGATLCGAGGGGFMALITKEPNVDAAIAAALREEECVLYRVNVHERGLCTWFEKADAPAAEEQ